MLRRIRLLSLSVSLSLCVSVSLSLSMCVCVYVCIRHDVQNVLFMLPLLNHNNSMGNSSHFRVVETGVWRERIISKKQKLDLIWLFLNLAHPSAFLFNWLLLRAGNFKAWETFY